MPSKIQSVKSCETELRIPYLSSDGCKNDLFKHCGHLHFNPCLPIRISFAAERDSFGADAAVWDLREAIDSLS
jgi:hypothetical protein